jgi:transposase
MGGRRPVKLAGQRAFILKRIASKPDITIRGLMAELAERGSIASYGAVWTFLHRQRQSYKKKPARQRARPPRRRPSPHPLEEASAPD